MVKKNTSIELAVALMLKGMAYMLCILVCAMFLLLSALSETFVKELTLDEAVSSIVYRFHSNWRIYILLC
jgi:Na+-transporting methylmalonyl-CoA/oxaloacetate decarboxylase gamma subunit